MSLMSMILDTPPRSLQRPENMEARALDNVRGLMNYSTFHRQVHGSTIVIQSRPDDLPGIIILPGEEGAP